MYCISVIHQLNLSTANYPKNKASCALCIPTCNRWFQVVSDSRFSHKFLCYFIFNVQLQKDKLSIPTTQRELDIPEGQVGNNAPRKSRGIKKAGKMIFFPCRYCPKVTPLVLCIEVQCTCKTMVRESLNTVQKYLSFQFR